MMYKDALREVLNRVYRNTDDCEMRISKDCYKLIIEALEKQIPKKPIDEECYYICPCCGRVLDWSEVKNELRKRLFS